MVQGLQLPRCCPKPSSTVLAAQLHQQKSPAATQVRNAPAYIAWKQNQALICEKNIYLNSPNENTHGGFSKISISEVVTRTAKVSAPWEQLSHSEAKCNFVEATSLEEY